MEEHGTRESTGRGGLALALAGGAIGLAAVQYYRRSQGKKAEEGHSPVASIAHGEGNKVVRIVTINKPAAELYRFWHDFENLPRFMYHLEAVEDLGNGRSRWRAKAPAGATIQWEAALINDVENELIAWQSVEDSEVANAGSVRFTPAPGGRGTEVKVTLSYDPPAGKLGVLVAGLFGEEPSRQVADDLRRFKQLVEAGEVPTNERRPAGASPLPTPTGLLADAGATPATAGS
jgi:uncharacterized membrane protein